ncbi:hypothetical protein Tco_0489653 [Tanacetum coccineum]
MRSSHMRVVDMGSDYDDCYEFSGDEDELLHSNDIRLNVIFVLLYNSGGIVIQFTMNSGEEDHSGEKKLSKVHYRFISKWLWFIIRKTLRVKDYGVSSTRTTLKI